jgi:hypothetical protein
VEDPAPELQHVGLLSHDQVELHSSKTPEIRFEDWGTPMIVDPLLAARDRDP